MKERDYKGMPIEDYDKLCNYCIENDFDRFHEDFSKFVDDKDCVSLITSIVTWKNHDANQELYCVAVAMSAGDMSLFCCGEIQVQKCVSSFGEFIDFITDVDKLKRMYKEFFKK